MDLDQMVAALDIHIVGMALGVAMLAASQIGRHMGRRVRGMDDLKPSKFDDASIGLLTLLLAFSFGTSIAKHDQRRRRSSPTPMQLATSTVAPAWSRSPAEPSYRL
jgi:hypothetical protein